MSFEVETLEIPGTRLIRPRVYVDERGAVFESYRKREFDNAGLPTEFPQDNFSYSRPGVLRGLHYQGPEGGQAKLVGVRGGEVYAVAADLREGSPTHGAWVSRHLSEDEFSMLFVPEGCAFGFCTPTGEAYVHFKLTAVYQPEHAGGVRWDDPTLDVDWPLKAPDLSSKDEALPFLEDIDPGFRFDENG